MEPDGVAIPLHNETERAANIGENFSQLTIQDSSTENPSPTESTDSSTENPSPTNLHSSQIQLFKIPKRKEAGTLGRNITVETNMLPIKFGQNFPSEVIHYDVKINPDTPKYILRTVFIEAKNKLFPGRNPAFDGKQNAYSAWPLFDEPEINTEVKVFNEEGKEKNFKVTMKKVNVLDLSWVKKENPDIEERNQTCIQVLDVILRHASAIHSKSIVGRSFFSPPVGMVHSLGNGMDLWIGLFQSAVLGWKPFLNIDVAHKGFPKAQSVLDLIKTICGMDEGDNGGSNARGQYRGGNNYQSRPTELTPSLINQYRSDIVDFLKGLKILVELPNQATSRRIYRFNDFVKCPQQNHFLHNERAISVEMYYKLEKKYSIKFPLLPCLWVGPKEKNIHVPIELCTVIGGQATQKKLNERQTSSMIRFAATDTDTRKQKIMNSFAAMKHKEDPCMTEFDLSLGGDFEKVPARVLPSPKLEYDNNKTVNVSKGVWRNDKVGFFCPSTEIGMNNSWTILSLDNRANDRSLHDLKSKLQKTGENLGIVIGEPLTPFANINFRANSFFNDLVRYLDERKKWGLQLIIVIVPDAKNAYTKVKQISELHVGILTQCIKSKTLYKLSDSTIGNILLKINTKLNGTNHALVSGFEDFSRPACLNEPTIIFGADVTHPATDATKVPSIAAVTASNDPNAFNYKVEIRLQPARKEIIQDLKEIVIKQLIYFKNRTGYEPSKIIFYRDGVGEGEFKRVMQAEVNAIREACTSLSENYQPKITFLIVQKRHHVRFFPTSQANSDDYHKNKNVQAGTIVDSEITNPAYTNFYLVSHASIQGTARPTKYCCLWDDSDFTENELEKLTYFLCHTFSRCTRSVSYPTPTYYAHLAAFRARTLIQDAGIKMENLQLEQMLKMSIKDEIINGKPMFFV